MKNFLIKIIKHPFFITLAAAMVVLCVVLYGTLKWLDSYTLHNEAVIVPNVKGLKMEDAAIFIKNSGLRYNIIDSVYSKNVIPGAIVEILPTTGSKVKKGRILFITVNALTSQMGEIPEVEDLSFRQAYAMLKNRGFESVEIIYVNGVYKDLAIGVELHKRLLDMGDMVPLNSPLILKVSSGETDPFSYDSLLVEPAIEPIQPLNSDAETWF
jgi:hypothetical protein